MRKFWKYGWHALLTGFLVILPIYLTVLLLLKATKTAGGLVKPLVGLLPDWFPAQYVLSFLFVAILCFLVGLAVRTSIGQAARNRIESSVFQKIPGYSLFRSMTRQLAGESGETAWKAALVEIEDALVPAFIIEELDDGSFTVFRSFGAYSDGGRGLYSRRPPGAPVGRTVHAGTQDRLTLGIWLEGSGSRNATKGHAVLENEMQADVASGPERRRAHVSTVKRCASFNSLSTR